MTTPETPLHWRKATKSNASGGACVEVADNVSAFVAVRDSKDPHGPVLTFSPKVWSVFVAGTKAGTFDPA